MKIPKQGIWQNIMKKTILNGLIGLTLFGGVLMTYRVYEYYTVIKPLKEERIQIIRQVEMLAQRESDELYAREHPH